MGEIVVAVELENPVDRAVVERGYGRESDVRRTTVEAIADTGAMISMLPQDVVERLGTAIYRTVVVTYADERTEDRPVAGPVTMKIGNCSMNTDCVVGPLHSQPHVGHIVMEGLGLIADCTKRTLTPRPESPEYPELRP